MSQVIIGKDPHKRSATIEVMAGDETVLGGGRYLTDAAGYRAMLTSVRQWPDRRWAIEGCQGIGRHIASRLLAASEQVIDGAAQAVRPRPRVLDRAGPQDRRHRRALGRVSLDSR
jgi:hypothetical protein